MPVEGINSLPVMNTTPPPSPSNVQGNVRRQSISDMPCPSYVALQAVVHAVNADPTSMPLVQAYRTPPEQPSPPVAPKHVPNTHPEARDESNSSDQVSPQGHGNVGRSGQGFRLANAIINKLPQELGSVNVLLELQRDLRRARALTGSGAEPRPRSMPELLSHTDDVLTESLEQLRAHFDELLKRNLGSCLKTALERYRLSCIARWYEDAKGRKEKRRYSLAVIFGEVFLPEFAWKLRHMPKKERDDKLQSRWKSNVYKYRFWLQLVNACGSEAVLLLLPGTFPDEQ